MKRRDFVKGLAAVPMTMIPAANAISEVPFPLENSTDGNKKAAAANCSNNLLNVVVHGMFAIVVDRKGKLDTNGNKYIYLTSPQIAGTNPHCYRAQAYTPDGAGGVTKVWTTDYDVTARSNSDSVIFKRCQDAKLGVNTGLDRLVVDVSQKTSDPAIPFWTIKLPIPDKIYPLRATPFNYLDGSSLVPDAYGNLVFNDTYRYNDMVLEQALPTIYVLTYNKIASGERVMLNNQASLEVPFPGGVGRLHFYAEPETNSMSHNPADGIKAISTLFRPNLTLRFNPNLSDPDQPLKHDSSSTVGQVPGMLLCEERSLSELDQQCRQFAGQGTIEEQYKKFLDFEQALDLLDKTKSVNLASAPTLTKNDVKPPRNCIAMIANYS